MENQFFVDSEHLSPEALAKKHRIESDPSSRKNHMEYLPGMEIIESDVCSQVMTQMNSYDYNKYTVLPKCLLVSSLALSAICSRKGSAAGDRSALKSSIEQVVCSRAARTSLAVYLL